MVDTDGKVVAPSKLTVLQLVAELQARGLMTEGSRKELYKRVQVLLPTCTHIFSIRLYKAPASATQMPSAARRPSSLLWRTASCPSST